MSHLPLSCMVNMDDAIDGICCLLSSRDVRTMLICGPSGTGKSVAARGVSRLFPGICQIEVPVNVTLESLYGSVDMEVAIGTGECVRSNSIFSRSNGGIIIVDNANLMDNGTLFAIVETVSEGVARAEIGGLSSDYPCDSRLICTMDPDEGPLPEHILDRFDICVFTSNTDSEEVHRSIMMLNLANERDPSSIESSVSRKEAVLRSRIDSARLRNPTVPNDYPDMISKICKEMHVEGHRGDVAVLNVAIALSALDGLDMAGMEQLRTAVRLCLEHRRKDESEETEPQQQEMEQEQSDDDSSDDSMDERRDQDHEQQQQDNGNEQGPETSEDSNQDEHPDDGQASNDDDGDDEDDGGPATDRVFSIGETFDVRDFIPPQTRRNRNRKSGRREKSRSDDGSGRTVGHRIPNGRVRDISLTASIRAAAPYQSSREHNGLAVVLHDDDLRERVRVKVKGTRILFVVDGSGSVGAHERMVAVKGAVLSMLEDAYRRRDEVGMVVFRGETAENTLPMTRSVLTAYMHLSELPTGGRTPLLSGLAMGYDILRPEADAGREPVMVVLTDGRGNVGLDGGKQDPEELKRITETLSQSGIRILVVDTEVGCIRFGRAIELSKLLSADYVVLEDLDARSLSDTVRSAMGIFEV